MNGVQESQQPEPIEEDTALEPREAALLLDRTTRNARRRLSTSRAYVSAVSAFAVLVIYGSLWNSTRGQHPYRGPSLSTVGLVYVIVAVGALIAINARTRASRGVRGASRHQDLMAALPIGGGMLGIYTFLAALSFDGFSHAITIGVADAAAPWIVVGVAVAGYGAGREDRWRIAGGLAMVVCGAGAAFFGPSDVWGVLAVCGFVLLMARGGVLIAQARR